MNSKYKVIGLMSGTSLDGVDIACCEFEFNNKWTFKLLDAETISYEKDWEKKLSEIHNGSASEISEIDSSYGNYLGRLVKIFCDKHRLAPDFISSHGHTVFHQPQNGFTLQIGSGAHLSVVSGFPVICDFRSCDVALGGQGAPLVPVGDKYLFPESDYCLNLGGIANISFDDNGERKAFDICACNLVLNFYANKKGFSFDENGTMASRGNTNIALLNALNILGYYSGSFPKSLGREDVEKDILPLIDSHKLNVEDILATFCEHVAAQISKITESDSGKKKMLVTGGGVFNSFLVKKIIEKSGVEVVIPKKEIIEYKEAIIFAFLGVLRMRNEINCLKSVTGARMDSSGGAIYRP